MRICFFSTLKGSPWGGSEELWASACSRAIAAGHETLISRYEWDTTPPKLAALVQAGAKTVLRPRRPGKLARLFSRPKWLRAIEAFNPDVICISQGGAYECAGHRSARPLLKWLKRVPVPVVNVIQFNSEDASLGSAAAEHARRLYQRAAVNAFVAQHNITLAAHRLGMTIPRPRVVVNPVNLADPSQLPWPHGSTVRFAAVARLDARTKGQDLLIAALSTPEWKARDWSLSFFGEGRDQTAFREQAQMAGIGERIHFRGHTADIRDIWREHHALLLPSRAEGTPLAMMEAMLLARPALVCDVGGCAGWITDGVEGVIAPAAKLDHVAAALARLWSLKDRWPELGRNARARAMRQLGPDPTTSPGAAFLDLLLHAAAAHRTAPAASHA